MVTHRWNCWSSQAIPTHAGPCSRQYPLLSPRNNRAPLPLCDCWYVLSVETVRDEIQLTPDKNPQNCREFFLSWIVSDNEVKKIWWLQRIVSANSLFRHYAHNKVTWSANWLVGLEPDIYQNKVLYTGLKTVYESRWHQNKTTKDKWQKWRKDGRLSQKDVIFVVMDALVKVLVGEVLLLHCHENGDCHAVALRASELSRYARTVGLSYSNRLVIATQNAHASRLSSILARKKMWMKQSQSSWLLPSTRVPLLVFMVRSLLLLGFLDLVLSGLQLRGWSSTVTRMGKCQDRSVGYIQRALFWSSKTRPDWRTS